MDGLIPVKDQVAKFAACAENDGHGLSSELIAGLSKVKREVWRELREVPAECLQIIGEDKVFAKLITHPNLTYDNFGGSLAGVAFRVLQEPLYVESLAGKPQYLQMLSRVLERDVQNKSADFADLLDCLRSQRRGVIALIEVNPDVISAIEERAKNGWTGLTGQLAQVVSVLEEIANKLSQKIPTASILRELRNKAADPSTSFYSRD